MSAKAPAGGVKRKNGRDATVDIRESKNVDEPSMFIVQVAAVSCAATHVPESKTANQSFRYSGFRRAAKVEVLLRSSFTGVVTGRSESHPKTRPIFTQVPSLDWPQGVSASVCEYAETFLRIDPIQYVQALTRL
jgi:hypothetical protein